MNDDESVEEETEEERQEYLAKLMETENQMIDLRHKIEDKIRQLQEKGENT